MHQVCRSASCHVGGCFYIRPDEMRYKLAKVSVCLSSQISLLKQSLELQLSQSQSALQQLQSQFNQERELLSQQMKGQTWLHGH